MVDCTLYVSVTNNNQPPRVGCLLLLAEKRVVLALETSIGGEVGGSMPVPKNTMKPTIYLESTMKMKPTIYLRRALDTDDWVVKEDLRPWR